MTLFGACRLDTWCRVTRAVAASLRCVGITVVTRLEQVHRMARYVVTGVSSGVVSLL